MHLICVNLQREVYPLLLLFPAGRKNETVSYEGDSIVSDIIKFLAAHGSHVMDLITNQGNCVMVLSHVPLHGPSISLFFYSTCILRFRRTIESI